MAMKAMKPKSDYSIQTVSNALRMLESFYKADELGVSELSRRLRLHKNNVFRLLATLEEHGYIEQSPETERYRLGTRCLELSQSFVRGHSLLRSAHPVLNELALKAGETAHLAVLRDHEVVHLDGVQPDRMLLTGLRVGDRLPVNCTALGKILMSCSGEAVREGFVAAMAPGSCFSARTEKTIVETEKLAQEFERVGRQGLALDIEECEMGMCCAAAPVYDASGQLVGALSISGPASRLTRDALQSESGRWVMSAAEQLSLALGHRPES
jgi:DNA-binding IclR family transcriptional regulator